MVEIHERQIASLQEKLAGGDEHIAAAERELQVVQSQLNTATKAIEDLEKFYGMVRRDWGTPGQRTIGFIRRSPPVAFNVQPGGFTEDWGTFVLDEDRWKAQFKGNVLDLGAF